MQWTIVNNAKPHVRFRLQQVDDIGLVMDFDFSGLLTALVDWREIVAVALIFVALERVVPIRPAQKLLRSSWGNDLVYLLCNRVLVKVGSAFLIGGLLIALSMLVPPAVGVFVRAQPLWLQVVELLVLGDAGFYLAHRLAHGVPFLWRFHAIHHSIEEMDWLAGSRVHPVDQIISNFFKFMPLLLLGFSAEAMLIFGLIYILHSTLVHSNLKLSLGPLDHLIAMPLFHHWHHANEPDAHGHNYGGQLLMMDWMFGTLRVPSGFPARYGTDEQVPALYLSQLAWPLQRQEGATSLASPLVNPVVNDER